MHLLRSLHPCQIQHVLRLSFIGAPSQQPPAQAGQAGEAQAQWAEYYRSLGYAYYGQQGNVPPQPVPGQPPASTAGPGQQKVTTVQRLHSPLESLLYNLSLKTVFSGIYIFHFYKVEDTC